MKKLTHAEVKKLRNSGRYRKERRQFMQENPDCVKCKAEDIVEAATDLDHIIPIHDRPDLFWDHTNWQPLCREHHKEKTDRENAVRWNNKGPKDSEFADALAELKGEILAE